MAYGKQKKLESGDMENIVPCKMCQKDFNYIPGSAGNARQLCDGCRLIADEKEVQEFIEQTIIEKNKYLIDAPGRKDVYDPSDILLNGNIPTLESDADKFICAIEFSKFIKQNGFGGKEENASQFLKYLGNTHCVLFLKQMPLDLMEYMAKREEFKWLLLKMMKIAI
jgi:hypothetical protein